MKQYLDMCRFVLENGKKKEDRTGTGTISTFGYQTRYNLEEGFPLLTTKKVYFKAILGELLWFIKGNTNIKELVDQNIKIWNEWPYETYKKSNEYQGESLQEFVEKIKESNDFADKWGDLGPVYGKQWRNFNGVDQLMKLQDSLKNNPFSRRHIISAWNPAEVDNMALPPCHSFMQFYVSDDKKLSCQLYQRSADLFLGVPFNIASYALLTIMLAKVCGYGLGDFVHTFGDLHLYANHIEQAKLQITRQPFSLPNMTLNPKITNIFDFKYEDFSLSNYQSHPHIKAEVAI